MTIRRLLRILHRDLGYFIVGMIVVYALSGIYLNHRHDFNPDYKIFVEDFKVEVKNESSYSANDIKTILQTLDFDLRYKKHYINNEGFVKVFIENGEVVINPETGEGRLQYLQKRPLIFSFNKLHKASIGALWKWVSDFMAVVLLFVGISGLFLMKGKRGFNRWGIWFTIGGIIVPLVFILLFV